MMTNKENVKNMIGHVINGDLDNASTAFKVIFDNKYRDSLEAKKIAIASKLYDKSNKQN